jgi:hypothetical protein
MERLLTVLIASLCVAILFGLLGATLVWWLTKDSGGGSDSSIAYGYFGILAGLGLAAIGFFLTWYLTQRFLLPTYLRYIQIADGIGLLALVVVWLMQASQEPVRLQYDRHWAALEVEARANKSLLGGEPVSSVISMDYSGGQSSGNFPKPESAREEGSFVILPWATAPFQVKTWDVRVFLRGEPVLFTLGLPKYPTQSTEWSNWMPPIQYQEHVVPANVQQGLTLRYRFRLIPSNEEYY